jgi:hypothetical protein
MSGRRETIATEKPAATGAKRNNVAPMLGNCSEVRKKNASRPTAVPETAPTAVAVSEAFQFIKGITLGNQG